MQQNIFYTWTDFDLKGSLGAFLSSTSFKFLIMDCLFQRLRETEDLHDDEIREKNRLTLAYEDISQKSKVLPNDFIYLEVLWTFLLLYERVWIER